MIHLGILLLIILLTRSETIENKNLTNTRRLQNGNPVGETRPYMVYLKPAPQSDPQLIVNNWLCGGVIIHPRHILTSAACIEDVQNFYVVSGTFTWSPHNEETECVKNGAKKAVWKCTPQDYYFDGAEFDNMRWMSADIAVVKVDEDFNFKKRVRGCDFIPNMIRFNNDSQELEKAGTVASIAGWGSTGIFADVAIGRSAQNSPALLESEVQIISKRNCKKRWDQRYHNIIEESMICSKDDQDSSSMSDICANQGVKCKELEYEDDEYDEEAKKKALRVLDPSDLEVHGAWHQQPNARRFKIASGGFCENDHGGPLVVGHGTTSVVIGVMSSCMTKNVSMKCYGPYLYTSVFKYKHVIDCAIQQDIGKSETCRRSLQNGAPQFRINEVYLNWRSAEKKYKQASLLL